MSVSQYITNEHVFNTTTTVPAVVLYSTATLKIVMLASTLSHEEIIQRDLLALIAANGGTLPLTSVNVMETTILANNQSWSSVYDGATIDFNPSTLPAVSGSGSGGGVTSISSLTDKDTYDFSSNTSIAAIATKANNAVPSVNGKTGAVSLASSDLTDASGSVRYASRAAVNPASIPASTKQIIVGGYASAGDCPDHAYTWSSAAPSANYDPLTYFADTSARGGYWIINEDVLDYRFFGAVGNSKGVQSFALTSGSTTAVLANGSFTASDVGKIIGFNVGGPAVAAIFRFDLIGNLYASSRTLTINGVAITFVASGATGNQVNVGATIYDTAVNIVSFVNANTSALACTASVDNQSGLTGDSITIKLTANTPGYAGNNIVVSWSDGNNLIWPYYPTFYNGSNSGPLVTTISAVTNATTIVLGTAASATIYPSAINYAHYGTNDTAACAAAHSICGLGATGSNGGTDIWNTVVGTAIGGQAVAGVRKIVVKPSKAGGAYFVTQPLLINNGSDIKIERGAVVRAAPGFPAERAVFETRLMQDKYGYNYPTNSWILSGYGMIECVWADRGLWARTSNYGYVGDKLNIVGAKWKGIQIGDSTAGNGVVGGTGYPGTWSNNIGDVMVQGSGIQTNMSPSGVGITITVASGSTAVTGTGTSFDVSWQGYMLYNSSGMFIGKVASVTSATSLTLTAAASQAFTSVRYIVGGFNSPDSIGIHNKRGTDMVWTGPIEVVGYRYGILLDSAVSVGPSHVWTWGGGGPTKACYVSRSAMSTLISPEGDTPCSLGDTKIGTCYFFWSTDDLVIQDGSRCFSAGDGINALNGSLNNEVVYARKENYATGKRLTFFGAAYNSSGNSISLLRASSASVTYDEGAITFLGGFKTRGSNIQNMGFCSVDTPNANHKQWLDNTDFSVIRQPGVINVSTGTNYVAERWWFNTDATTGTRTAQVVTSSPGASAQRGKNSLQISQTAALNGTYHSLFQNIPYDSLWGINNRTLTLLIRTSLVSGTYPGGVINATLVFNFGTGGSASQTVNIGSIYVGAQYNAIPVQAYFAPGGVTIGTNPYVQLVLSIPVSNTASFVLNLSDIELVDGYVMMAERQVSQPEKTNITAMKQFYETGSVYAPSTTAFWVPLITKYKVPTVAVVGGSASQISATGFLLTPTAAGTVTYTADASV
jgi:hypothetical protein